MSLLNPESENRIKSPIASDIYKQHINPDNSVAVVGPSTSIFEDYTLFLVSSLLTRRGTLFVVDPQASKDSRDFEEIRKESGGYVTGHGEIDRHIDQILTLEKLGIPLAKPKWLGKKSSAQNILLPDHSCDVLADHNTALFVAGTKGYKSNEKRQEMALASFKEYSRVLNRNGTLLFQTSNEYDLDKGLEALLASVGISAYKLEVEDGARIPVSEDVYKKLKKPDVINKAVKKDSFFWSNLADAVRVDNNGPYLFFGKPNWNSEESIQYRCPTFYIGRKT